MHILMIKRSLAGLAVCLCFYSCAPQGALTPKDSFTQLRDAAGRSDSEAIVRLLSGESRQKIKHATALISRMDDKGVRALSRYYGITADRMKNLSIEDYITLSMVLNKGNSIFHDITAYSLIGINRNKRRAVVRLENGMELDFVREGPYWKFDMTRL